MTCASIFPTVVASSQIIASDVVSLKSLWVFLHFTTHTVLFFIAFSHADIVKIDHQHLYNFKFAIKSFSTDSSNVHNFDLV